MTTTTASPAPRPSPARGIEAPVARSRAALIAVAAVLAAWLLVAVVGGPVVFALVGDPARSMLVHGALTTVVQCVVGLAFLAAAVAAQRLLPADAAPLPSRALLLLLVAYLSVQVLALGPIISAFLAPPAVAGPSTFAGLVHLLGNAVGFAAILVGAGVAWQVERRISGAGSRQVVALAAAIVAVILLRSSVRYLMPFAGVVAFMTGMFVAQVAVIAWGVVFALRLRARVGRVGRCRSCGYDVAGLVTEICPECGQSWRMQLVTAPPATPPRAEGS